MTASPALSLGLHFARRPGDRGSAPTTGSRFAQTARALLIMRRRMEREKTANFKTCAAIERRVVEEVGAQALQAYFERKKLKL